MSTRVIDDSFAGLAYPRRGFSVGRSDLPTTERPGPFLVALVTAMTQDGAFDYDAKIDPGVAMGFETVYRPPRQGASLRSARYLDDEDELVA